MTQPGETLSLVDPTATRHRLRSLATRPSAADPLRVGLVDGTLNKASLWGQGMLDAAEDVLRRCIPRAVFSREQLNPLENPPPDRWASAVARRFEIVVLSAGDCVTCTTRAVRDAVWLQAEGVPSALVCTAAMRDVVDDVCAAYGLPGLAVFAVDQSLFGADREEIAKRSAASVAGICQAVVTGREVGVSGATR